jgi:hypothetical protein
MLAWALAFLRRFPKKERAAERNRRLHGCSSETCSTLSHMRNESEILSPVAKIFGEGLVSPIFQCYRMLLFQTAGGCPENRRYG